MPRRRTISDLTATTADTTGTHETEDDPWREDGGALRDATGMPIWLEWGGGASRKQCQGAQSVPGGNVSFRCRPRRRDAQAGDCAGKARPSTHCWWRLVWCHERCLKQECDVRRQAVSMAAREAGALLICMKKASKFAAWLASKHRPPLVLLTDWREAKPCLQAASEQPLQNQPAITLVLCDVPSQFERAQAWARSGPAGSEKVRVIRDVGLPGELLAELLPELLQTDLVANWEAGAEAEVEPDDEADGECEAPPGDAHSSTWPDIQT